LLQSFWNVFIYPKYNQSYKIEKDNITPQDLGVLNSWPNITNISQRTEGEISQFFTK